MRARKQLVALVAGLMWITTLSGCTPSGQAMPVGNLPGWRQVFTDDFVSAEGFPSRWFSYSGQPDGDPAAWWDPSHVEVKNGMLVLRGYRDDRFGGRFVTGGVSNGPALSQSYGKYLVRMRVDKGNGIGYAALLWRSDDSPEGEVDFAEDAGGDRTKTTATQHWGAENHILQHYLYGDFSVWHTFGIEWTPGTFTYTVDGMVWATTDSAFTPSEPMFLALQSQAWPCLWWTTCIDASTPANVDVQVDWVAVYARA
jgi:beta-glucanase (GH16 family)